MWTITPSVESKQKESLPEAARGTGFPLLYKAAA